MNSKDLEPVIEDYKNRVLQGEQRDKVIEDLHTDGLSIVDTIKVVRILYQMNLKDAHSTVADHPAWQSTVKNAEPLHNTIEKALKIATRFGLCQQTGTSTYSFDLQKRTEKG